MGTDIHPVIEVWNHDVWTTWAEIHFFIRDYWLFQVLGGPRRPNEKYATVEERGERGLPDDSEIATGGLSWAVDPVGDHSHSWASLSELEEWASDYLANWPWPEVPRANPHLEAIIGAMRALELAGEKTRLLWGYDS